MSKTYSEYFRNRFIKHDSEIKEIIEQIVKPKSIYRKKRDYRDAFTNDPPYTKFSDELEDEKNNLEPTTTT